MQEEGPREAGKSPSLEMPKTRFEKAKKKLVSELDGQDDLLYNLSYPKHQLSQHSAWLALVSTNQNLLELLLLIAQ